MKSIENEMNNVGIDFEILEKSQYAPFRWSKEIFHLIFEVNIDFIR